MLLTIIKNNFKLMLRNKMVLLMMIVAPILVIAALASAFHGLLSNSYTTENFTIGYYFEENSPFAQMEDAFLKVMKEQNIATEKYSSNEMEYAVTKGRVDIFLYCSEDSCEIGAGDTDSIQAKICEYTMQQFIKEYQLSIANMERVMTGGQELKKVSILSKALPYTRTAEAKDYYGIIEIIYFMWCGLIFLTAVVQSERRNHIQKRFVISPASGITLYLGKFIPCELISVASLTISALAATLLFDIRWGNIPGTIAILFLVSLAATAFGIVLLYLVKNLSVSVILLFGIVWIAGFIGGSFETYMYSTNTEAVKRLSPLYYANRTIVEYSTMGHSDYTGGCILYMLGILLVCLIFGAFLMNRRMEEN